MIEAYDNTIEGLLGRGFSGKSYGGAEIGQFR